MGRMRRRAGKENKSERLRGREEWKEEGGKNGIREGREKG